MKKTLNKKLQFNKGIADRLEWVSLENDDAVNVIKRLDFEDAFFYLDPPYINTNQGHYKGYMDADFEKLLQCLSTIK